MAYRTLTELVVRCKAGIHLSVNDHLDVYQTIQERIAEVNSDGDEISPETAQKMIASGVMCRLQFYPLTPVGFYVVYGESPDVTAEAAHQILDTL